MIGSDVPPGWPLTNNFYSSPNWLRFVDSDGLGESAYAAKGETGVVAHLAKQDVHPDYSFDRIFDGNGMEPRILMGGRRGYSSPIVSGNTSASELSGLMESILRFFPEANGAWWWPFLPSADIPSVLTAAYRLAGQVPGVHLLDAQYVVPTVPRDKPYETTLASSQARTNWRREWRQFTESGLELRRVSLEDVVEYGAPLLQQVELKYGNTHDVDDLRATLRRQDKYLSSESVAHAVFDGPRMTGYSLAYRWGDQLALRTIGLDYSNMRNAAEYAILLMHAPVRFAQQYGLTSLHLGTGSSEAKCRRGAYPQALWAIAPGTKTSTISIRKKASSLASDLPSSHAVGILSEIETVISEIAKGVR